MKFEKKHIKLGKPYIEDNRIKVVIEEQSHRGDEFGNEKCPIGECRDGGAEGYKASSGLWLASRVCPQRSLLDHVVYMRGSDRLEDHDPLIFSTLEDYIEFEEAVKEYNEHFRAPTKLDQSIFNGLDKKWQWAAIDEDGRVFLYTAKPVIGELGQWVSICYPPRYSAADGYSGSDWKNSLIEREEEVKEVTMEELHKLLGYEVKIKKC